MSETQQAECRSSKPEAAGSIPVAHFFDFGFWILDFGFAIAFRPQLVIEGLSVKKLLNVEAERASLKLIQNPKSKIQNRFGCVVSIGKMPVSKTGVFSSNLNAPAKYPPTPLRRKT